MTPKYPIVFIVWIDITVKQGWSSQEEVDNFCMDDNENKVLQTGFLYEEDENQVCILDSHFKEQDLLGTITKIPKGAILSMVTMLHPPKEN